MRRPGSAGGFRAWELDITRPPSDATRAPVLELASGAA